MIRLLVTCLFFGLYQVLIVSFAEVFGASGFFALVAPVCLTFCVFFLKPFEGIVVTCAIGYMVDAMSGMPIGWNMSLMLVMWFGSWIMASWLLGKPEWWALAVFVLTSSWVYRVAMGAAGNWGWKSLVLAPFFDALIGIILIRILYAVLISSKKGVQTHHAVFR